MAQALSNGSLLDHGKYRVEKILGQGGFGLTYLVTDLGLDKYRALKEFFPKDFCERNETTSHVSLGTTNTADFVEKLKAKFIKEARNIANLDQHPGIVKIHTVFEENNTAYYVMDFIEGESLSAVVKRSGPVPVGKGLRYIRLVGEALEYVHSHNINHLDVKPANIMVRRKDDKPILIDFGLAKQYDSEGNQTSTTPTGISHGFAPFEQYREGGVKEFSPQTDIYSLAATLYYIISGKVPPHATDLIESELTFPPGFPEFLKDPLRKAMSSRRLDRPESVSMFLQSIAGHEDMAEEVVIVPAEDETVVISNISNNKGKKGKKGKKTSEPHQEDHGVIVQEIVDAPAGGGVVPPANNDGGIIDTPVDMGDEYGNMFETPKKGNKFVWLYVALGFVVCLVGGFFLFGGNSDNESGGDEYAYVPTEDTVPTDSIITVSKMAYESPFGICAYAGPIDADGKPHGRGVATWDRGEAKSYDGEWVHGVMEGEATYVHSSGDTFEGFFKDNKYSQGKYTIKSDGSYFIGSYKDGKPDKGDWFLKDGTKI